MSSGAGKRRVVAIAVVLLVAACRSGPPTPADYRAIGEVATQEARFEIRDAYVWRQPDDDAITVLLSDRRLPALPADDAWPVVDLTLAIAWAQSPHAELALDARGELQRVYGRGTTRSASSAPCNGNPGACGSSIAYLGADAIDASYEFRNDYDVTLVQPIRRQSNAQRTLASGSGDAPRPETAVQQGDHDRMAERYSRVRAALDAGSLDAFLVANGYDQPTRAALATFDGLAFGVQRLANGCPRATAFEAFGNDGAFGSLIAKGGEREMAVYFVRRGDEWLLHSCGDG